MKVVLVASSALFCAVSFGGEQSTPLTSGIPKGTSAEERLKVAKSVKVKTDILGVELGSTLQAAHAKLDGLNDPAQPWKELKARDGAVKAVWQLDKTPYKSVYVKTNAKREIDYLTGFVRAGEEVPFEQIGEAKKAPLQNDTTIVWDVIRPNRPPIRLVAEGKERKASVIKLFVVARPLR